MQNVEDRNSILNLPSYRIDARQFPGDRAIFVASPGTLAWWPSSTAYGNIMSVASVAGTITRVVIRYGGKDLSVPAVVPLKSSVSLAGYGRLSNTSPETRCGMNCVIRKPSGETISGKDDMITRQEPGVELRFNLLSFSVDQAGIWQAIIQYYTLE